VTHLHPAQLATHVHARAARTQRIGIHLLGVSLCACVLASCPRLLEMLARRRRHRQLHLLAAQQQRQQLLQQELQQQLQQRMAAAAAARRANAPDSDDMAEQEEAEEGRGACIVCCDAARDTILLPCAHQILCNLCAARLPQRLCPVCRLPFCHVIYVSLDHSQHVS